MLKLTRRTLFSMFPKSESRIHIVLEDGRRIVVTVLESGRSRARLGFEADRGIKIVREELLNRPSQDVGE